MALHTQQYQLPLNDCVYDIFELKVTDQMNESAHGCRIYLDPFNQV